MAIKSAEDYISAHPKWETELRELREMILTTEVEETIKWGAPVYTVNDKNVVAIAAFKNHAALWFYQGALLKKHTALLENAQEGKTKALRQVRLEKGKEIPLKELRNYVLEAIQNQKEGKEIKPQRGKKVEIPPFLATAFENDDDLKKAFFALTPGKQREYCEHISEAKRETTKFSRLEKISPMVKEGQGLHDKYKNC
ncbi:YdeI/OmpD-associated family protein [Salinimicrobium flavum]|uniref:YdeI family protein n=1 Tax=Salinimicrobium flavum TaxID=1737065 RepID=A0ABW5IW73_9FLAO